MRRRLLIRMSDSYPAPSTSRLPHASQQQHQSSPPRSFVPLRRSSTVGELDHPNVHVDLAKPQRALTAERLAQWNTSPDVHQPHLSGSGQEQRKSSTNFVDLFVGKGAAARHPSASGQVQQPESNEEPSPQRISTPTYKETASSSILDGPAGWFSNLVSPTTNRNSIDPGLAPEADESPPPSQTLLDEEDQLARDWHVLKDAYQTPKYPVVLAHGLLGFDKVFHSSSNIGRTN